MVPTLVDGDWLLVDPDAFRSRAARTGDLVVVPDPRDARRVLIKRVGAVQPDGRVALVGDAPDASTDSRVFGPIDPATIVGRPWFRYWPVRRFGRVG